MLISKAKQSECISFSDGYLIGIQIKDGSIEKNLTENIYLSLDTVGIDRFYRAYANDRKITKLVKIPMINRIDNVQFVELFEFKWLNEGKIYRVIQIQEVYDSRPSHYKLSLEEVNQRYDDLR